MWPHSKIGAITFAVILIPSIARSEDRRADFLKLIERPKVALAPEAKQLPSSGDLAEFHFSYAADAQQRVPGILIEKSADDATARRRPVVIALHGTGGKKEDELPLLTKLAERGFVAVAIDGRYHGERTAAGKGSAEYQEAILKAWHGSGEHPFYYDTVWDVMRLIDYLETRDDVDKARIGLYGVSKGGIETYLAAAVAPRIAVAVPCIGMQSFKWAGDHDAWQSRIGTIQKAFDEAAKQADVMSPDAAFVHKFYDKIAPGIDGEFDGPAMVKLIAPRPLMLINGDSDARTPLAGLQLCIDAAGDAYKAADAADHLVVRIQEKTGHKVNPDSQQAAIEWFEKWLRP